MSRARVVALSGGIGGAKLALGLYRVLPPDTLTVIVNTGDDFEHLGLHICPDLDTTLYTLAGLANAELGWGRRDETWTFMQTLEALGGETWFRLGDADLALHVERTQRLKGGAGLSAIAADLARRLGIEAAIVPVSDDPIRTRIATRDGELAFQDYFVRHRCAPRVQGITYQGAAAARLAPPALAALQSAALEAIIICPSNPYLSVDPLLAVPQLLPAVRAARRAGDRGDAAHRRGGGQGPDRQDHARARHCPDAARRRAALRSLDRCLRARSRRCGAGDRLSMSRCT